MGSKLPGKRARLRNAINAAQANVVQARADIEDVMGLTQDAVEDVMKVVLADMKLTMELTEARLEQLRWERDHIEHRLLRLPNEEWFHFEYYATEYWKSLPWWKRLINFDMRPSNVCR